MTNKETKVFWLIAEPIVSGRWTVGRKLPSYAMLAKTLGISDQTISRVMYALRMSGFVQGAQGEGTYVSNEWNELWKVRLARITNELDITTKESLPDLENVAVARPRTYHTRDK